MGTVFGNVRCADLITIESRIKCLACILQLMGQDFCLNILNQISFRMSLNVWGILYTLSAPPRIILADMKKASQQPGVKRSAKPKAQANGTGADESAPDQAKPGPKANPKRVPKAKAK